MSTPHRVSLFLELPIRYQAILIKATKASIKKLEADELAPFFALQIAIWGIEFFDALALKSPKTAPPPYHSPAEVRG